MIKGIHHVALVVRDLDAAARYYCATAEMHRLPDAISKALASIHPTMIAPAHLPYGHALLAGRNGYLELLAPQWPSCTPEAEANPINRQGIRHFCVQNFDCTRLETTVLGYGGSLIAAPLDLGTGNQYAYSRDCERNIMEIEGLPYAPASEPTWLGHIAVVTHDIERAIGFYAPLFGSKLQNRGRFGPTPKMDRMGGLVDARLEGAWLQAGNMLLELWQFHAPENPAETTQRQFFDPGYSHICLETDDLDTEMARLVHLGGKLLTDPTTNDQLSSVYACDSEGNTIELLELVGAMETLSISVLDAPAVCARVEAGR